MIVSVAVATFGSDTDASEVLLRRVVLGVALSSFAAADRWAGDFAIFIVLAAVALGDLVAFAPEALAAAFGAALAGAAFIAGAFAADALAALGAGFFPEAGFVALALLAGIAAAAFVVLVDFGNAFAGAAFAAAFTGAAFAANAFPAGFAPALEAGALEAGAFGAAALEAVFGVAFAADFFGAVLVAARTAIGWVRPEAFRLSSLVMSQSSFRAVLSEG